MRTFLLLLSLILLSLGVSAQSDPYDDHLKPVVEDLQQKYMGDTSAKAVVLDEIGHAAIVNLDDGGQELEYKYYTRIRILKPDGIEKATRKIFLYRDNTEYQERVSDIAGSSFTLEAGEIKEVALNPKNIILNNESKIHNSASFSIPGAVTGSIIEFRYTVHSPFFYEFHSWAFQSDVPKLKSVFTAVIPATYTYHVSLKGSRKLDIQKAEIESHCLVFGNGGVSDCSKLIFGMLNVPALHEEAYVSAMSDYTSQIDFELVSRLVNGTYTKKITETWKDEDRYMQQSEEFGLALKRATGFFKPVLDSLVKGKATDSLKARSIYALLRQRLTWNDIYSSYSEISPKKLWSDRKGTSGELNLALVAALRAAGLDANPLLLSCRQFGSPRKIFPVRSDFNNILAVLDLNGSRYFLDITDKYMPFGLISRQSLTHEGRLFPVRDSSRWVPIDLPHTSKNFTRYDLKLSADGSLKGKVTEYQYGYDALEEKEHRRKFSTEDDYLDSKTRTWQNSHIISYSQLGMNDPEEQLESHFDIELANYHAQGGKRISLSPFLSPVFGSHLFKASERLYPVDLGRQINETVLVEIQLPPGYKVTDQPAELKVRLPDGGGFFVMSEGLQGDIYQLSYKLSFLKDVYAAADYPTLKEFISQIVKAQQKFLVLEKN